MPLFSYKAQNSKGEVISEITQAGNKSEAVNTLQSLGYKVLSLKSVDANANSLFEGSVSIAEKATFSRFLATMLRAGLPLTEGLDVIGKETPSEKLKKVLLDVSFQTRRGNSLSASMGKYPKVFDPIFLTIVKAGEQAGTLEKSFDYLSKQLLISYEMTQKVKGAMVYPAVIVTAMIANAIVMLVFVLPKMSGVFSTLNLKLPATTKAILAVGNFVGANTVLVMVAVLLSVIIGIIFFSWGTTREMLVALLTKVPMVKRLRDQIDVSRFSRTLSTLLDNGVPIMEALDVSADVISQLKLKKEAKLFSEGVGRGEALSDLLEKSKGVFPKVVTQTIKAGEKTGALEEVLIELAEFFEKEVDYTLKSLTSLIEPIIMIVIGVGVGALVVMMIIPIYSVVGGMEGGF